MAILQKFNKIFLLIFSGLNLLIIVLYRVNYVSKHVFILN
jgi:hypothetical protein